MFEIVIISGKGGTGKTSITGALACLAGESILVDCDVDAANLSLILNNRIEESHEFIAGNKAKINQDKCNACGECLRYCRFNAVTQSGESYRIEPLACEGCGVCRLFCPEEAIEFRPVKSGDWYRSTTPFGSLIHARLGIAQSNSGRLVTLLRQQARKLSAERGNSQIIIDGPPGIGCPVIASITGAGFVLLVTEPSLTAFHDLKRVLELIRHFDIACGICINKFDINPDLSAEIEKFADRNDVPVLGKIDFDPTITTAQINKSNFVDYSTEVVQNQVKSLWKKLGEEISKPAKHKIKLNIIN